MLVIELINRLLLFTLVLELFGWLLVKVLFFVIEPIIIGLGLIFSWLFFLIIEPIIVNLGLGLSLLAGFIRVPSAGRVKFVAAGLPLDLSTEVELGLFLRLEVSEARLIPALDDVLEDVLDSCRIHLVRLRLFVRFLLFPTELVVLKIVVF